MSFIIESASELAKKVIKIIEEKHPSRFIVGLCGDLGAGKTALVKEIAKKLSVGQEITSPTFNILKTYYLPLNSLELKTMCHVDLYRLKRPGSLDLAEILDSIKQPKTISFIEWIENSPEIMKMADMIVEISVISKNSRKVEIICK